MPQFAGIFGKNDRLAFDIPIREIVSIEPADFPANKAVRIRYRSPNRKKEISIIWSALSHIRRGEGGRVRWRAGGALRDG